jgi:hypothetical protein
MGGVSGDSVNLLDTRPKAKMKQATRANAAVLMA